MENLSDPAQNVALTDKEMETRNKGYTVSYLTHALSNSQRKRIKRRGRDNI